jgi:hypothetical protein
MPLTFKADPFKVNNEEVLFPELAPVDEIIR